MQWNVELQFAFILTIGLPLLTKEDILCPVQADKDVFGYMSVEDGECYTMLNSHVNDKVIDQYEEHKSKCLEFPDGEFYSFLLPEEDDERTRRGYDGLTNISSHSVVLLTSVKIHSHVDLTDGKNYDETYGQPHKVADNYFMTIGRGKDLYGKLAHLMGDDLFHIGAASVYPMCIYFELNKGALKKMVLPCKYSSKGIMKYFTKNALYGIMCRHSTFTNCVGWDKHNCKCKIGYQGKYCTQGGCSPTTCQHGGTCESLEKQYFCYCTPGWSGKNCEIKVTSCSDKPCYGNSNCTDIQFYYVCHCPPERTGMNCEVDSGPCSLSPCKNGGECLATTNTVFTCKCKNSFVGDTCETALNLLIPPKKTTTPTVNFVGAFVPWMIIGTFLSLYFIHENTGRNARNTGFRMLFSRSKATGKQHGSMRSKSPKSPR
uniref:EGF-like domain-containing protein n=1 Tax=Trichuris muris TaxID=70415 RepID=A0A5S6QTU0_TRIMR